MASLADAITITSATSGQVLAAQSVSIAALSGAQKTALLAFVNSLGLSIPAANVLNVQVYRTTGAPNTIGCMVTGIVIPASAAVALANRNSYEDIIGVVP